MEYGYFVYIFRTREYEFTASQKKNLVKNKFTSGDSSSRSTVKRYLKKEKNYICCDHGEFGNVFSALTIKNESVSIKVVKNQISWQIEGKI